MSAAARLAAAWQAPAVGGGSAALSGTITLAGALGAGKTTFTRHLLRALGVRGPVRSPTYALLEPYVLPSSGGRPEIALAHCDFFRFEDPREWDDAGLREVFGHPGLRIVEWPSKVGDLIGPVDLALEITHPSGAADDTRRVEATARTAAGAAWLAAITGAPRTAS